MDVRDSGKGEGSLSIDRECGFVGFRKVVTPTTLPGRLLFEERPFKGVGGGEVLILLRSLRVM